MSVVKNFFENNRMKISADAIDWKIPCGALRRRVGGHLFYSEIEVPHGVADTVGIPDNMGAVVIARSQFVWCDPASLLDGVFRKELR
jgi:hypothetical protein